MAELHHKSGYLHIIMGPMFAGKTTTLLSELQAEEVGTLAVSCEGSW